MQRIAFLWIEQIEEILETLPSAALYLKRKIHVKRLALYRSLLSVLTFKEHNSNKIKILREKIHNAMKLDVLKLTTQKYLSAMSTGGMYGKCISQH